MRRHRHYNWKESRKENLPCEQSLKKKRGVGWGEERERKVCSVDSTWADSRDFRKSKHSDRKSEHWINMP